MTPSLLEAPETDDTELSADPGQPEAPDWGVNNRDAPDCIKQAILSAFKEAQNQEKYVRRQEILQDAQHRFYDMGIQHIYQGKDHCYIQAQPGGTFFGANGEEAFGEYIDDYDIFHPFALIQQAKLSENMPGIDFQAVDPNEPDDIEAANAAEGMRHEFDRNNDVKSIQKEIIYHLQMGGRSVCWTRTDDAPEKFGDSQGGKPRRTSISTIYGVIESKVPLFANSQADFWYAILYDDPDIKIAKTKYPWIADKLSAGQICLDENQYERIARLGVIQGAQGSRYGFRIGDSLAHLISRGHGWLRLSAFEDANQDYVDQSGSPEQIEDENGPRNIKIKEKIAQVYPRGVHVCVVGDQYAESFAQSMDDCLTVAHAFIGKGQSRMPIMKSMVVVQDRFNSSMNYIAENFDYGAPSIWLSCQPAEYAAIKKQHASPWSFRNMKTLPNGVTKMQDAVYREPSPEIPNSFVEYVQLIMGQLPQFQLSVPPSIWGESMKDQKLMDVNEPIPTPNGYFVRNGDLKSGDSIFGQDGKPYRIVKAHPIQEMEAYRVSFSDGTSTCVHAGHLWETQTRDERIKSHKKKRKFSKVRTTQEISDTLYAGSEDTRMGLCLNHSIAVSSPIEQPEAVLPIDPYCLGAWLGDGRATGGSHFTATDADGPRILEHFQSAGYQIKKTKSKNDWTIFGLTHDLGRLGVVGNKHIPEIYLWSSPEQRLALLQGLMDTDGNCSPRGRSRFCNTNKSLADGVYHLAASLGLKVFRSSGPCELNGIKCADAHYVEWSGDVPVFRLPRKLKGLKWNRRASVNNRHIVSVEPVGKMRMRCLTTDNPTGLYLFGRNFNVTHNTASGYQLAASQAMGILGVFWTVETHMLANMYYHNCLAIMNDPDYPEQVAIPGQGGKNLVIRKESLSKGDFRAFPDTESGFPESTAAKRQTLSTVMTQMENTPIGAQVMGSPDNVAVVFRTYGVPELVIPEVISRDKQLREIDTLLDGSPLLAAPMVSMLAQGADVPTLVDAIQQAIAQGQQMAQAEMQAHAALGLAAQAMGQPTPPVPPPFNPASVARSSVQVWKSDYHVWEAKKCRDWMSSEECNSELTIGRSQSGNAMRDTAEPKPNIAGVLNLFLHWQEHEAMAALESPPMSGPLPAPNIGKVVPPLPGGVTPAVAAPAAPGA